MYIIRQYLRQLLGNTHCPAFLTYPGAHTHPDATQTLVHPVTSCLLQLLSHPSFPQAENTSFDGHVTGAENSNIAVIQKNILENTISII